MRSTYSASGRSPCATELPRESIVAAPFDGPRDNIVAAPVEGALAIAAPCASYIWLLTGIPGWNPGLKNGAALPYWPGTICPGAKEAGDGVEKSPKFELLTL